jgi:hypothetical protein
MSTTVADFAGNQNDSTCRLDAAALIDRGHGRDEIILRSHPSLSQLSTDAALGSTGERGAVATYLSPEPDASDSMGRRPARYQSDEGELPDRAVDASFMAKGSASQLAQESLSDQDSRPRSSHPQRPFSCKGRLATPQLSVSQRSQQSAPRRLARRLEQNERLTPIVTGPPKRWRSSSQSGQSHRSRPTTARKYSLHSGDWIWDTGLNPGL